MNIIITAGGTQESIDSVRKITNMSTGKLGTVISKQFTKVWDKVLNNTNKIFYICNKDSILPPHNSAIELVLTTDMESVKEVVNQLLTEHTIDYFIHSMAVSDYKVEGAYKMDLSSIDTTTKMQSNNDEIYLKLIKTVKIIDSIKQLQPNIELISFKLRDRVTEQELIEIGTDQLHRTNSSLVIANDLQYIRQGNHIAFAITNNSVTKLISKKSIASFVYKYCSSNV